ncbi:MAG: hypothetical protein FIA97_02145 [Methylococcaceae bacterium]|nr:hypothetical protein [Methylococcaceae bacterium]
MYVYGNYLNRRRVTGGGEALGGLVDSIGLVADTAYRDDGVVAVRLGLAAPASKQAERPRIGVAGTANPISNSRQMGCDRFAGFRKGRNRRGSADVRANPLRRQAVRGIP